MNAALVLFTRELREKSRLFIGCAVLAVVPFLATLLPGTQGQRQDVIAMVGGFLAIIVGMGMTVVSGSSVIARDLAERRMSFWLAKPIPPAALWFGKASAALLACLVCTALIAIPAMLSGGDAWKTYWLGETSVLGVAALGLAVLFLVSHAFATVVRSRSMLLALDFVFVIIAAGALLFLVWPVVLGGAVEVTKWLAIAIAAAMLLVLAVAPVWQLERGRADIRRSHAAFSRFFWPAIAVILAAAGGYVAWLVSPEPADLRSILTVAQPPRGTKVLVTGTTSGRGDYHATFVIDTKSGSYERVATPPWWGTESSKDGKIMAWLEPSGVFSVKFLELHVNGRGTGIQLTPSSRFVLSDDGTRIAADTGQAIAVYELATGRLLGSAAGFDSRSQASIYFVTNDLVRVVETMPLRIAELDLRTRRLTRSAARMLHTPAGSSISVSGDGTRMFVRGPNVIADARTGATIATLEQERYGTASMLHDGSVAAVAYVNAVPRLRLFAPDGRRLHEVPLSGVVWIAGEVEGGKLLVARRGGTMFVVDVHRGTLVRKLDGVSGPMPSFSADPRLVRYGADQELVGRAGDGKLVVWKHEGRAEARPLLQSR